jgi:hypothetical protein
VCTYHRGVNACTMTLFVRKLKLLYTFGDGQTFESLLHVVDCEIISYIPVDELF